MRRSGCPRPFDRLRVAPSRVEGRLLVAGDFRVTYDARGVTGLASTRDRHGAQVIAPNGRLGVVLKYRVEGGDWPDLY